MSLSNAKALRAAPAGASLGACLVLFCMAGCTKDMADQPRYEPYEPSTFFDDGAAMQHPPVGTIAQGQLNADELFYTGRIAGQLAETFPAQVENDLRDAARGPQLLARGRQRYDIYCAPCHDRTGSGRGMVVQRGFPAPPSFHLDRLRDKPVGHFFDVMTYGFGRMYDYAAQLPPEDRWAVAAYLRALQLSQHAPLDKLSDQDRQQLTAMQSP